MAKRLRLSRARFYQLVESGVFPPPVYCCLTRKPLYTLELQETCIRIRQTGIAFSGQFVRFYDHRKARKPDSEQNQARIILRSMGLSVTAVQMQEAQSQLKWPGRRQKLTDPETIRLLFRYFHGERQNGV